MDVGYQTLAQNTSIEAFKEEKSSIEKQYNKYDVRQDPRFGETIIFKNKMGILFCNLTHSIPIQKKKYYKQLNRFCKMRKSLDHKYILQLMHYYAVETEDYTIRNWMFNLMFEYPNNDLKLELRYRIIHATRFSIEELWKIAKGECLTRSRGHRLLLHVRQCLRIRL